MSSHIELPITFNSGTWTEPVTCDEKGIIRGAELRINTAQQTITALGLRCIGEKSNLLVFATNETGEWKTKQFCPTSRYIIGFDLRMALEADQFLTAVVNDIGLICNDGTRLDLGGLQHGQIVGEQRCPNGTAVCGGQIHFSNGVYSMSTGINVVRLACCPYEETTSKRMLRSQV